MNADYLRGLKLAIDIAQSEAASYRAEIKLGATDANKYLAIANALDGLAEELISRASGEKSCVSRTVESPEEFADSLQKSAL